MTLYDIVPVLCLHLYALGTVAAVAGLLARNLRIQQLALGLTVLGFVLHTALLGVSFWGNRPITRNEYIIGLAWCLVALGLGLGWRLRQRMLFLGLPPMALFFILVSLILGQGSQPVPESVSGPLFTIHLGAIFLGIGAMALAAGVAVIFLWQEYAIKAKSQLSGFRKDLPALASLDKVNAVATMVGFPLYTLGLLFGFVWAGLVWGNAFSGDPKEIISIFIWLIYAALFHFRLARGWHGRKPALLSLVIFLATLFSLLVINTLVPTHHNFTSVTNSPL